MALSVNLKGSCFCVITGASQGIGRALAIELSQYMGPNSVLLLIARNLEGLVVTKSLVSNVNVHTMIKSFDLSEVSSEEMNNILSEALQDYDISKFNVNMIVHNVGSIGDVKLSASQLDDVQTWRKYYDLNVFSVATLNCAFLNIFDNFEERMSVVNITSLAGIKPFVGLPLYCSGKAAREMYFKVLSEERPKIKVLNYAPGPVKTDMVENIINVTSNTDLKKSFVALKDENKLLEPQQTAKKCVDVLIKGDFKSGDHVDFYD